MTALQEIKTKLAEAEALVSKLESDLKIERRPQPDSRDPHDAFQDAIDAGRLSTDAGAENYAGRFMYMGPNINGTGDAFKHKFTREYLAR